MALDGPISLRECDGSLIIVEEVGYIETGRMRDRAEGENDGNTAASA
jgi:hypothetical protein